MCSPLPGDVKDRLESVVENTELLHRQIKGGGAHAHHGVALNPSEFHTRFFQSGQRVSDACTKLAMLFSKPPAPTAVETGTLCGLLEQSTLQMTSMYFQVSPYQGKFFQQEVRDSTLDILEGVANLAKTLIRDGSIGHARLQGTGTVWDQCDSLAKTSKDNRAAVIRVLISQLHLLKDAHSEVEELEANNGLGDVMDDDDLEGIPPSVNNGLSDLVAGMSVSGGDSGDGSGRSAAEGSADNGPREWNGAEGKMVNPCIRLIQLSSDIVGDMCRLVISHASVECQQFIGELDRAGELIKQLSPIIDELAEELPAPVAMDSCRELGLRLGTLLQGLVDDSSGYHFIRKAKESWNGHKFKRTISVAMHDLQHS